MNKIIIGVFFSVIMFGCTDNVDSFDSKTTVECISSTKPTIRIQEATRHNGTKVYRWFADGCEHNGGETLYDNVESAMGAAEFFCPDALNWVEYVSTKELHKDNEVAIGEWVTDTTFSYSTPYSLFGRLRYYEDGEITFEPLPQGDYYRLTNKEIDTLETAIKNAKKIIERLIEEERNR